MPDQEKLRFRAVFLSDIHLGTRDCQAEKLSAFLKRVQCEYLFLVGDIIDVWNLRRRWYWPSSHNDVVRRIIKREVKGTHVIFVPGNHDEVFRDYDGMRFGGVEIHNKYIHKTLLGERVLVVHGDEFDAVTTNHRLITAVGDWLYYVLLWMNRGVNRLRRRFGRPYWSLSGFIKGRVKTIVQFVSKFEEYVTRMAHDEKVDSVICGHIHQPQIRMIKDVKYCNCGDWVENCTAIVETLDGVLELHDFKHIDQHPAQEQATAPIPEGVLAENDVDFDLTGELEELVEAVHKSGDIEELESVIDEELEPALSGSGRDRSGM